VRVGINGGVGSQCRSVRGVLMGVRTGCGVMGAILPKSIEGCSASKRLNIAIMSW
jgi:hypothetical protein